MKLSIVTTLYRSAPYLREFHRRCRDAALRLTDDYEFILVDDGSPDESLDVALELRQGDPRVGVVQLARNFGQHKAIMTGLAHATGDLVFLLDADLEEAPEWLLDFHRKMQEADADVVYGVQEQRAGGWWKRISGDVFYRIFNALADCRVPPNLVTTRLMTKDYVEALVAHREREIFLAGLWSITGFRQAPLTVNKGVKGTTCYTFRRKLNLVLDSVTSFSTAPLRYIFYSGAGILMVSIVTACAAFAQWCAGTVMSGWTSLIISIWLLGGMILFSIGVLAIYVGKALSEAKQRPYTIVRKAWPAGSAAIPLRKAG